MESIKGIFDYIWVTIPKDSNSDKSTFDVRKLVAIVLIISVVAIIVGLWLFDSSGNIIQKDNMLPPNCYLLNGKQICPNP